jgi:hypothetical protein
MSQLFKNPVPNGELFKFLDNNSIKTKKYYLINRLTFKKSVSTKTLMTFYEDLSKYYHNSKRFYLKRDLKFNYFITIIRQICKNNNIKFISKINYNNAKYNLEYYIYM